MASAQSVNRTAREALLASRKAASASAVTPVPSFPEVAAPAQAAPIAKTSPRKAFKVTDQAVPLANTTSKRQASTAHISRYGQRRKKTT